MQSDKWPQYSDVKMLPHLKPGGRWTLWSLARFEEMGISQPEVHLCAVVQDKHQCTTHTTNNVGDESLEQTCGKALLRGDLFEAIHGALVEVLFDRLLGLHLQTTSHCVKGVSGTG